MNINKENSPIIQTNVSLKDIDLSLFSNIKKNNVNSSQSFLSNITEEINNTKKEIFQLKNQNKNLCYDTYMDTNQTVKRKLDADSILDHFTAINTSTNSYSDIEVSTSIKHMDYNINEFTQKEIDLYNAYGDENISIKSLLEEIVKKNEKISEMERGKEYSSSTRCDSERRYNEAVKELNEIKNLYEKNKEKLVSDNEVIKKENEELKKEKENLIKQLIKEKYKNKMIVMKYEQVIKNIYAEYINFRTEWNKSN